MVPALPDVPDAAGGGARRGPRPTRDRPVGPPLPARRADGGGRRLPGGAARGRAPPAPAGRRRSHLGGALVRAARRVPGVGRDPRPQPADGRRAGGRLRGGDGARLPARHVRPRGPDAPDPAPGRVRPRRGVAGGPGCGQPHRLLVAGAGRVGRAGRVPSRRLRERGGHPRRRQGPGRAHPGPRGRAGGAAGPRRPPPVDERRRPPAAATSPRPGGGRGRRPHRRPPPGDHVA